MSVLKYFKNIPRSPSHRATGPKCNFFFFKFATKSLEKKKGGPVAPPNGRQGPVAHPSGDRPLSPVGGATGPPLFFLQGLRCKFEEKKITLWACRPMGGRPGYIFEIFENGHIFLKF